MSHREPKTKGGRPSTSTRHLGKQYTFIGALDEGEEGGEEEVGPISPLRNPPTRL
jgi:hypothetical protein